MSAIEDKEFKEKLKLACEYMADEDAVGSVYGVSRVDGELHMSRIIPSSVKPKSLAATYEMVIFDGGNKHGDSWKATFYINEEIMSWVSDHQMFES